MIHTEFITIITNVNKKFNLVQSYLHNVWQKFYKILTLNKCFSEYSFKINILNLSFIFSPPIFRKYISIYLTNEADAAKILGLRTDHEISLVNAFCQTLQDSYSLPYHIFRICANQICWNQKLTWHNHSKDKQRKRIKNWIGLCTIQRDPSLTLLTAETKTDSSNFCTFFTKTRMEAIPTKKGGGEQENRS